MSVLIALPREDDHGNVLNAPHPPVPALRHVSVGLVDPWDAMTPGEQQDHIDACPNLCDICDGRRAFGICASCGGVTEETGEYDLSRCCGSRVHFPGPDDDDRRAA